MIGIFHSSANLPLTLQPNTFVSLQHIWSSTTNKSEFDEGNGKANLTCMLEQDPFRLLSRTGKRSTMPSSIISIVENRHRILSIPHKVDTFVRCCIVRDTRGTRNLCPRFIFSFQSEEKVLAMIALKQAGNRRSNYHIFDISNNGNNAMKLSKKSGNYIGKLKRDKRAKRKGMRSYSLFNWSDEKEQVAAFMFDTFSFTQHLSRFPPPRSFLVMLPKVDKNGNSIPMKTLPSKKSYFSVKTRMLSIQPIHDTQSDDDKSIDMTILQSRRPRKESGRYRLNFNGRVKFPSVKNMQLENENGDLFMQFGRIDKDKFHLDFR